MQIIIIIILVITLGYLIYSQYENFSTIKKISSRPNIVRVKGRDITRPHGPNLPNKPNKPHDHHKPNEHHKPNYNSNNWNYSGGYYSNRYDYPLFWYDYFLPWNWNYLFYPSLYDPYFTPAFDYSDNCHEKCADRYMNEPNDFEYNRKVSSCINEYCY